ncbi:MAG: lysozyme [Candidatus Eremiobacteraeota bacterium]|nr:lysozyme [Candidatus Eremiobacteraeota bacterium]
MPTVNGLDVSGHDDGIDLGTIADDGYSLVFIKATQGDYYHSASFDAQWRGATAAGMVHGAYHFFDFNIDATAQANFFLERYPLGPGALPPAVDAEQLYDRNGHPVPIPSADRCVAAVARFNEIVEARTGVRNILYMGYYFWRDYLGATDGFAGHPLWLAQYPEPKRTASPPPTAAPALIPAPWRGNWTFWQYTDVGRLAGFNKNLDLNVFNGNLDQLRAMVMR